MKRQKNSRNILITFIAFLMIMSTNSYAKKQSGLYLTASDYKSEKLAYNDDCKIRLNNSVLEMNYITVLDHGQKYKFSKSQIYGYVGPDQKTYRFYKKQSYMIAETGPICIYLQNEYVDQYKDRKKVMIKYFFSKAPDSELIPLSSDNLKFCFQQNEKFQDLIDQFFGNGNIEAFDNIHNTFKINYVYKKSLQ